MKNSIPHVIIIVLLVALTSAVAYDLGRGSVSQTATTSISRGNYPLGKADSNPNDDGTGIFFGITANNNPNDDGVVEFLGQGPSIGWTPGVERPIVGDSTFQQIEGTSHNLDGEQTGSLTPDGRFIPLYPGTSTSLPEIPMEVTTTPARSKFLGEQPILDGQQTGSIDEYGVFHPLPASTPKLRSQLAIEDTGTIRQVQLKEPVLLAVRMQSLIDEALPCSEVRERETIRPQFGFLTTDGDFVGIQTPRTPTVLWVNTNGQVSRGAGVTVHWSIDYIDSCAGEERPQETPTLKAP